ncbi:MAG: OsmC family protein [Deltaproteobacteria bacterium]|nr:OsmC family protein [Deltaproteobacteria bacterium]
MKKFVLDVGFPGGKKVDAKGGPYHIETDQAVAAGGEASAPEPFVLFLGSIATCAGIYALDFCNARKIDIDGMSLSMTCEWNEENKRYDKFAIDLKLPAGFPDKYTNAIIRAMDLCGVKKHIIDPPAFEVTAS